MNARIPSAAGRFAPAEVVVEQRERGTLLLRSPRPLQEHARCMGDFLEKWAQQDPGRLFLAERRGGAWYRLCYGDALMQVRSLATALLARGLSVERPLAILSENSINHALLTLAAMHVGIPVAPVSPAYSLVSSDHGKLKAIFSVLEPGMVYAADGGRYARALQAVARPGTEVVTDDGQAAGAGVTCIAELLATLVDEEVHKAFAGVGPDTVAKILFTSGSTGEPKGVINAQRMLCSNQQAIRQVWPFLEETPPVILDWLPWNHTFGGNHNFNMVLANGGTLYLDDGKPMPGLIEKTVANLREVSPNLYFNVPRGFDMLLPLLDEDDRARAGFFRNLQLVFYAAAALPQNLWEKLEQLARREQCRDLAMVSAWGATETAPLVTSVHFRIERAGVIGLPAPGVELKMIPNAGKLEMRVRGPNVMPGYWKRPELTRDVFDEEGFYKIGDAGRFADPDDPARGIEFDGRIAEDFKLMSGVWVHVGSLRVKGIAALAPIAQDIVVTGHDREEIGFLVFVNPAGVRALCPDLPADTPMERLIADARVRAKVEEGLALMAAQSTGSSTCPTRALLMIEPPSIDASEITDKGYINQRAVLARRARWVERLYAAQPDAEVIRAGAPPATVGAGSPAMRR